MHSEIWSLSNDLKQTSGHLATSNIASLTILTLRWYEYNRYTVHRCRDILFRKTLPNFFVQLNPLPDIKLRLNLASIKKREKKNVAILISLLMGKLSSNRSL